LISAFASATLFLSSDEFLDLIISLSPEELEELDEDEDPGELLFLD